MFTVYAAATLGLLASLVSSAPADFSRLDPFAKRDIGSSLGPQLSSGASVIYPSNPDWAIQSSRWSEYSAPSFIAVVKPAVEADVIATVNYAVSHNISFLAQGGGHGYAATLGVIQNAIMINMANLDYIRMNGTFVTVGGGSVVGALGNTTYAAGRQLTTGSCPCVGNIGATLGGGHGRLQGQHGLMLDNLVTLRVVLANGTAINVSETENSDLFWGMRGAGQNFGIVLEATYRTAPLVTGGTNYDVEMVFSDDKLEAVFDLVNEQIRRMPPELAVNILFAGVAETSRPILVVNFVYAGSQTDGQPWIQPWRDLEPVVLTEANFTWAELPYRTGNGLIAAWCEKGGFKHTYSNNIRVFNTQTMRNVYTSWGNFLEANPNMNRTVFLFEVYGQQAVRAVTERSTAYPHRRVANALSLIATWYTDPALDTAVSDWARGLRNDLAATSGYPRLYVYQNYAEGDEPLEAVYGYDNWRMERLRNLKRTYDPRNVFNGYHAISV
ncbi:MAG: hypothetical protein M1817_001710 [Caeruleum heppii]|nr:MAG: hypothetical protein M1817_001710 [Caeruleum heppii]